MPEGADLRVPLSVGSLRFFLRLFRIRKGRNLLHEESHQLEQLLTGKSVLSGVGRDVLEGPLKVLVLGQLASEGPGLLAAHPEQAVVGGQHDSVKVDDIGILVVSQDVVVGDVLGDGWVLEDEPDVLRAVGAERVPEVEEGLLVVVHRDRRFRQLWVEQLPQVDEVRLEHSLLDLGQQKVGHRLKVGDQLGRSVLLEVGVLASVGQEAEQELQDLVHRLGLLPRQERLAEGVGNCSGSSKGLPEVRRRHEADDEAGGRASDLLVRVSHQVLLRPDFERRDQPVLDVAVPGHLDGEPLQGWLRAGLGELPDLEQSKKSSKYISDDR